MNPEEIKGKIERIFKDAFPGEEFRWDKKQEEFPQWDSLSHMELVGKMEETLGVRFEMDEIMGFNTPGDFLKVIFKKLESISVA